tara:strand:- start:434 stop:1492 length:1059 start_codon:yes stop_codon:yes gene_type:complete
MNSEPILITGAAGFIGFHLTKELLKRNIQVIGVDNFNSYYDVNLKKAREKELYKYIKDGNFFEMVNCDIEDEDKVFKLFEGKNLNNKEIPIPKIVVNLAAQAGVRYSLENPKAYVNSNLLGFCNILEACKKFHIKHHIFASSSSVYGGNKKIPFKEFDNVDHPVSLYAATKKSNEVLAHSYSHIYKIPTTGLRFFTVYGPWGRPDMALFLFTKAILENKPINIFNNGDLIRDFTYIDDIVESLVRVINKPASPERNFDHYLPNPSTSWAPFKIFNIGNSNPVHLMDCIKALEDTLDLEAKKNFLPMQLGDVKVTQADTTSLESWIGFKPSTDIKDGIKKFIDWYKKYYEYEN